jgi:hypothetical protein
MLKKLGVFCLVLLTTLVCNRVDGQEDNYEISYVDCKIDTFLSDGELIIEIVLPKGMDIPGKFSTWQQGENGLGCGFEAVITSPHRFPDSNGNPLTSFKVETNATEDSDNTISLKIGTTATVVEAGWFTKNEHSSSDSSTRLHRNLRLDMSARPNLRCWDDYPGVAEIAYPVIFPEQTEE